MRIFPTSQRDNQRYVMRLELSAADVELLEGLVERVDKLAAIEDVLDVVAVEGPFITSQSIPTVTREGAEFLRQIVAGWDTPATAQAVAPKNDSMTTSQSEGV